MGWSARLSTVFGQRPTVVPWVGDDPAVVVGEPAHVVGGLAVVGEELAVVGEEPQPVSTAADASSAADQA